MTVFKTLSDLLSLTGLRLVAAVAILLIGIVVGRFIGKLVQKVLRELEVNKILKEEAGVKMPVEAFAGNVVSYLVYFIAVILALNQIGLSTTILYIVLIIVLLLVIVFIFLAIKDFIPNVTAGMFLHQKESFKIGDEIKVGSVEGKIIEVGLIETKVKVNSGDIIVVPNSIFTKNVVLIKKKK